MLRHCAVAGLYTSVVWFQVACSCSRPSIHWRANRNWLNVSLTTTNRKQYTPPGAWPTHAPIYTSNVLTNVLTGKKNVHNIVCVLTVLGSVYGKGGVMFLELGVQGGHERGRVWKGATRGCAPFPENFGTFSIKLVLWSTGQQTVTVVDTRKL